MSINESGEQVYSREMEEVTLFDEDEKDESPRYKLEIFEGPLDLLMSLIAKNKINIYDIPISVILEQYMEYIHQMELFNMEIASSFIVMASRLMLIKSRLLLPVQNDDEEDPRQELVDMLLEYQRAKKTADVLHDREFTYNGRYEKPSEEIEFDPEYKLTHDVEILREALLRALARAEEEDIGAIEMEQNIERHLRATNQVSVSEKITHVLRKLEKKQKARLDSFFDEVKSRDEVVATFLALLELIKGRKIKIAYYSDDFSDCDIVMGDGDDEEFDIFAQSEYSDQQ